jgi:hypothetical protein
LLTRLRAAGHAVVDFGAYTLTPDDDFPDFIIPLAAQLRRVPPESARSWSIDDVGPYP